eukprot:1154028-Pelagomonas_calceolata.AAC.13
MKGFARVGMKQARQDRAGRCTLKSALETSLSGLPEAETLPRLCFATRWKVERGPKRPHGPSPAALERRAVQP